jgi:hypothetical protein
MVISSPARMGRQAKTLTPLRIALGSHEWLR